MLDIVIEARRRSIGAFEVGRVLPFWQRRMVGPFIFFDHMGPMRLPPNVPRSTDVRPHPHIGLSTVTYLFEGEITHRDSLGVEQVIAPGALNWMTAGAGISHSERFDGPIRVQGGPVHGIQAWVALPEADEETAPGFAHHTPEELPTFGEAGLQARLIAGRAFGLSMPNWLRARPSDARRTTPSAGPMWCAAESPSTGGTMRRGNCSCSSRVSTRPCTRSRLPR
jgi:redox-sensitive bicupin YhaK (pirin superfamily)